MSVPTFLPLHLHSPNQMVRDSSSSATRSISSLFDPDPLVRAKALEATKYAEELVAVQRAARGRDHALHLRVRERLRNEIDALRSEIAQLMQAAVQANLARRHGAGLKFNFADRPALIGGLRVRVGSDVYDGSVRAGLEALEKSF